MFSSESEPWLVRVAAACPEVLCSEKCYLSILAPMTSCASPVASHLLCSYARKWVFAAWTTRRWSSGPSRRYPLRIFPWMPGPLPRLSFWCIYPFLPRRHRPSSVSKRVGTHTSPCSDFSTGPDYGAAVIPLRSGLQFCLPPRSLLPILHCRMAAVTFTSEHPMDCCLSTGRIC